MLPEHIHHFLGDRRDLEVAVFESADADAGEYGFAVETGRERQVDRAGPFGPLKQSRTTFLRQ
jgi:hypothetical protein